MAQNPNWPVAEYGWGAMWGANGGNSPLDRYVDLTKRSSGTLATQRGRQYELDQIQAGTVTGKFANNDGVLDPTNTGGPFAGHINPYQPFRVRAQYPPTANLLTAVQATGGEGFSPGTIPSNFDVFSTTDSSGGQIVASATAFQGGNVFQFAVPINSAARICRTAQVAAQPGATYTMQMQVRNVTASTSLSVRPYLAWYGSDPTAIPATFVLQGTYVLTGSASAPWTLITVTGTVPAGAYGMDVGVTCNTAAAACSVQVDAWQLEKGSAATAFTVPGTWYPIYAGYVERWPTSWDYGGTYGMIQPTAVDALALLSQRTLSDPLTQEIMSRSPRFLFKLNDPAGSQSFADALGAFPAAPIQSGKYGPGSVTAGNPITATDPVNGIYAGSTGTVATVSNLNPGTNLVVAASFISLTKAGITGPVDSGQGWTRMVAFRWTGGGNPAVQSYIWDASEKTRPAASVVNLSIDSAGHLVWTQGGPGGTFTIPFVTTNVADGNWHLAMFGHNPATSFAWTSVDGHDQSYSVGPGNAAVNIVADSVGNWADVTNGGGTAWNFKGDLAFVGEFSGVLGPANGAAVYGAWKNSFAGDSTDQRYARILKWAGYTGPSSIDTGLTTSMGPAAYSGTDALSALQTVVDTEGGEHFVDRTGAIVFRSRSARYNAFTPVFTFGENTGEFPYEDVSFDYDPTHLANLVTVTQTSTSQTFIGSDAASQAAYFPRTMTRSIDSTSALECQDAANYLLSRYKNPLTRVVALKLHPAAYPTLWPVCLSLELGMHVRVMRRPFGAPAIQVDAVVEKIEWDLDDAGEAYVTLQCSPVDLTPYGVLTSWHTTLNLQATAGAATLTVNASADNTNPLAAQLAPGQSLVLEPGSANSETVTVQSVSTTSAGWATAVITLSANLTKTHAATSVVAEPLPAGVTDPAKWDAVAKFDAIAFSY